jgi:hypothetical protein
MPLKRSKETRFVVMHLALDRSLRRSLYFYEHRRCPHYSSNVLDILYCMS